MKKIKNGTKNGKNRAGSILNVLIILLIILCFQALAAVEDSGGSVSIGSSYDSNPGDDEISATRGGRKELLKNVGDFSLDLSTDLFIYPVQSLYLDYFTALSYTFKDESYSFFSHNAEIAYEKGFENSDLNMGLVFGHTVYDFNEVYNRIEIEPYVEAVHYQSDVSSGWYRISWQYRHPFEFSDIYYEGQKISADISELITFMNRRSSLFLNSSFSLYLLEDSTEIYDAITVEKRNSYFLFAQNIRLKLGLSIFDLIPGLSYEFSYFFESDEWSGTKKKRTDHAIAPSFKIVINATDFLAIVLSYKYLKNFSTLGQGDSDYYDYNYDRHRVMLEFSFKF
ncbi:MAG TPA: hypothetical protein VLJ60_03880 [bacterium]|nr:hypothetical protein [bacterium]